MDRERIISMVRKYRYVLLILLAGIGLMLLPAGGEAEAKPMAAVSEQADMETRLEEILSRIEGAGKVRVMLTEAAGEEILYQTDDGGADTVVISDASRSEQGLIRSRQPPVYRGAIVVCAGGDRAAVRLAVVEAVSNVTGLGTDKITVLKME